MPRSKSDPPWEAPSILLQVFRIGSFVTVNTPIETTQFAGNGCEWRSQQSSKTLARTFRGRSVVLPTVNRTTAQRTKNTTISGTMRGRRCTGHTLSMLTFRSSQEPPFHLQDHRPRQSPLKLRPARPQVQRGSTYSYITSPHYTQNYAPVGGSVIKLRFS